MRSADYAEALDWLGRAERLRPDARPELLMATAYQHLKQLDMASHYLDLAKRHAPDNPEVQRSMAGFYRETGHFEEAIAALKSIRDPKPDVSAELAYTYQLDGKLDDSAKLYAQAANAAPKDLNLQLSAAQAAVAAGSLGQTAQFIERAAAINAGYYRLHAIRGEIARIEERDQDAVKEYIAAVASLPATPPEGPLYGIELHLELMDLYNGLADEASAQQQLQTAQTEIHTLGEHGSSEQGAGKAQFLRLRALIEMDAGHPEAALVDVKDALAINAQDRDTQDRDDLQLNGDILMKLGRTDDAIAVYQQILATEPSDRFALTSLGYAERAAGRDQDAERFFLRLAQADPKLYVPHLALGDLYTARRDFTKAEDSYGKAYALAPQRALILAGGMNAAIEAHNISLAGKWLSRVTGKM